MTPDTPAAIPPAASGRPAPVGFGEAFLFWLKLGFISFGGPAGQIAIMHQELVERRRWISERRFLHALNYCMLLPGPEAQQLATYIGWLMHRTWGGVIAGALFVLPSLFILILLSWVYIAFGEVPVVAGLFGPVDFRAFGFSPVVFSSSRLRWRPCSPSHPNPPRSRTTSGLSPSTAPAVGRISACCRMAGSRP